MDPPPGGVKVHTYAGCQVCSRGDLTIVALSDDDGDEEATFQTDRYLISDASPTLKILLAPEPAPPTPSTCPVHLRSPARLRLDESARDVDTFLSFLRAVREPNHPIPFPLRQLDALARMFAKWDVHQTLWNSLHDYVGYWADTLVACADLEAVPSLRPSKDDTWVIPECEAQCGTEQDGPRDTDALALLRVAHATQSTELWSALLSLHTPSSAYVCPAGLALCNLDMGVRIGLGPHIVRALMWVREKRRSREDMQDTCIVYNGEGIDGEGIGDGSEICAWTPMAIHTLW